MIHKVIIVGSGPAAHTAAIYSARAELHPLMFEGFVVGGIGAGGQLTITTMVENYPGFPDGVLGPDLMYNMREQSERHGTKIITETIASADISRSPFTVTTEAGSEFKCLSLIIATGAIAKRLNIPGEEKYWQRGISTCAICDGALPLFRNQPLVVIGGGDSACEEAIHLTNFSNSVFMVVRRDVMRASKVVQQRVRNNNGIEIIWNSVVRRAIGDGDLLNAIEVENVKSGEKKVINARGLFYAVGHIPCTQFLQGQLEIAENGCIVTASDSTATSVPGVFAAGDVQDSVYRQAVVAAGTGCMAALEADRYLATLPA